MTHAPDTQPAQPPQDQPQPTRLGSLLYVVRTLFEYGRHLAETVVARAANPNFASLAVCFGTADLPLIMARIERGILRATALGRLLDARLARGRDVKCVSPGYYTTKPLPEPVAAASQPAPAPKPARRSAAACRARWDDLLYPLTLEEIEAQVRRRPIGRTIVDICLDLAVVPALCGPIFNHLYDAIYWHRGNFNKWLGTRLKRYKAFGLERKRGPVNGWWDWQDDTPECLRGVLGFQIGEPPVLPAPP